MTALAESLRRRIAADGPITVHDFMASALGDPDHGYYTTRDPLGAAGDFTTAPEISQMFGELVGLWSAAVWQAMGAPAPVRLVELGPGRGTLMADMLRAAHALPAFRSALSVHLVETSPVLEARQRERLANAGVPLAWHRDVAEMPGDPAIVLANEFFDALPVHQAIRTPRGWHARRVGVGADESFVFVPDPAPLDEGVASGFPDAPVGAIFEWRDAEPMRVITDRIARDGGAILIFDYGHDDTAPGDTLQAVRRHAFVDPLATPGEADLTAHVDFAALARTAQAGGLAVHGPVAQGEFLRRLGIGRRAERLKSANPTKAAEIDAALARLLDPGRTGMGRLFRVLAAATPSLGRPPGFD